MAEELGDSQCSLDDSGSGAPGPHKLKRQGSSVPSLGKDADTASTYSDFSSGRCFHDVAGKTNVLMEDKELVSVHTSFICLFCLISLTSYH